MLTRRGWAGVLLGLAFGALTPAAWGQFGAMGTASLTKVKEPSAFRVYQRDRDGKADVPIVLDDPDLEVIQASLGNGRLEARFERGALRNVPTGGPYSVSFTTRSKSKDLVSAGGTVTDVYVGDVWVLAGQSNMEGYGDLADVEKGHPLVTALGMDGTWRRAEEPLHWLVDSPDKVHSGDPADREKRSAEQHKGRSKGAGLGLPFATAMAGATGVPVGLVPVAHGGTSLEQWSPSKKGEGGESLYGSMIRQVNLAGGKAAGVLWYQGESDANHPEASKVYEKAFGEFIRAVRSDLGRPELPFYFVQLGRYVTQGDPKGWNAVREAQRKVAEEVPNTAIVSVLDLELDDPIHLGTQGLKRAGQRLAKLAQRELFGLPGATTPMLDRVTRGPGNTLLVKFKGVNIGPEGAAAAGTVPRGMGSNLSAAARGATTGKVVGLRPQRRIGGFSLRSEDGKELPMIFEATVGNARDAVVLKLTGPAPAGASLWYGYGFDPYGNLTDSLDMAAPAFGPVALDGLK